MSTILKYFIVNLSTGVILPGLYNELENTEIAIKELVVESPNTGFLLAERKKIYTLEVKNLEESK